MATGALRIGGDGLQSQVWERCQVAFEGGKAGRHTVRILSWQVLD